MPQSSLLPVVRRIHQLVGVPALGCDSDTCLLQRFAGCGDQEAFAVLVRRHGPLVWRVCRRLLSRADLAEDAFQATWFVLARRAGSIRKPESLPSFLHGVAVRVAREARVRLKQQAQRQAPSRPTAAPDPGHEAAWRELGAILEEEIHRLPERLRLPVLLCYWQGLTNEEAGRRLGWPAGTVKTRLARARAVLHHRLTARGVTLPAGVAALLLAPAAGAEASVSLALAAATTRAVLTGVAAAPRAAALASGVLHAGLTRATGIGITLVLALGLLAGAASLLPRAGQAGGPARADLPAAKADPPRSARAPARSNKADAAVGAGLQWLVRQQARDGHWSLVGAPANDTAATALALLPLLQASAPRPGAGLFLPYAEPVERGLRALVRFQQKDGGFVGGMYAHALATWAVCEGYRRMDDPWLREPAQRALAYIAWAQHPLGGWRYTPGAPGDTSVTALQVLALSAGRAAGLDVPEAVGKKASAYLDTAAYAGGSAYGYIPGSGGTPAMAAAGLLCRFELGGRPAPAALAKGLANLQKLAPPGGPVNLYFYHYATRLMRAAGGADWQRWQPAMRHWLLTRQNLTASGADHGSWSPQGDAFGQAGGRLLITSLALLTLQTCAPLDQTAPAPLRHVLKGSELESFWKDLAEDDFLRARGAMRALAAGAKQSIPFLARKLQTPPPVPERQLARLIADLDAREFRVREQATRALQALGIRAVPGLRRALAATPSLEVRRRIERLLQPFNGPLAPETMRAQRVVQILAFIGSAEARRALETLAQTERESDLARAAQAALERLGRQPPPPP
jgi:RNA polymerase sigma factor (sigma-70 family)